jgi:hypothetical protein
MGLLSSRRNIRKHRGSGGEGSSSSAGPSNIDAQVDARGQARKEEMNAEWARRFDELMDRVEALYNTRAGEGQVRNSIIKASQYIFKVRSVEPIF